MSSGAPPDVVIIDDDARRAQWLREARPLAGRETLVVRWGPEIRPLIKLLAPQLIVAGISTLPAEPHATIRTLRADGYAEPILAVGTARDADTGDQLRASGATAYADVATIDSIDAYLAPYLPRRADHAAAEHGRAARFVHFEAAVVDLETYAVVRGGRSVRMSPTEFALFEMLWSSRGAVVSRDALEATVWAGRAVTSRVVDRHISSVRRHLEQDPRHPKHLHTVFGVGYRLDA